MPTGYTAPIAEGISFRQFALNCARAFGALIEMRDMPSDAKIPEKFETSNYHIKELEKAECEYKKLKGMSDSKAEKRARLEYEKELESHKKYIEDKHELKLKYLAMLDEVKKWTPPTPEHIEYKNFMIKQIEESIDFDCSTTYLTKPQLKSGRVWLNGKIEKVLRDIEYHKKEYAEEVGRVNGRNNWVNALRNSLPSV